MVCSPYRIQLEWSNRTREGLGMWHEGGRTELARTALRTAVAVTSQPRIQRGCFFGGKAKEREANHSSQRSGNFTVACTCMDDRVSAEFRTWRWFVQPAVPSEWTAWLIYASLRNSRVGEVAASSRRTCLE
jgi:hypothetical protein